ncbi:MAG: DUF2332 domain-containing protein [Henriciella sp.]|uniref:DUF2332 domain-containing protein n=1 Tax=Henriciella sp. TaxID=1968823 RepID=UPI003C748C90
MPGPSAVVDHFREQAGWCRALGSPLTADLCLAFAGDFDAGGVIYRLTADWPGSPRKDALALRLTGFLHHAVLSGAAEVLGAEYPAAQPDWSIDRIWPLARQWLQSNTDSAKRFIERAPQTNETRRSIAMLPGFLELAARFEMPMHLLELGASAGLNQNWDRFSYATDKWQLRREPESGVVIRTDWQAPPPAHLDASPEVASRAACDLNPIDISDPDQKLRLRSYVWPDQAERLARLDAAIELARQTGVSVEKADALDWVSRKLAARPKTGLTVVYHSVFLIYPPRDVIKAIMSAIDEAGAAATEAAPLAWLCCESEALFGGSPSSSGMVTRLQTWPGGQATLLNRSDGHVTKVTPA